MTSVIQISCGVQQLSVGMPLWSVEEWRARIGSSWAALGRQAVRCSSHYSCSKQRRQYVQCCPALGGGGGGEVLPVSAILPMMTTITLLVHSLSLIIVHPLEPGSPTKLHCEWDKNTQDSSNFHQSTTVVYSMMPLKILRSAPLIRTRCIIPATYRSVLNNCYP